MAGCEEHPQAEGGMAMPRAQEESRREPLGHVLRY
jgi:hypothetical protein